jgi:hypothetical protein
MVGLDEQQKEHWEKVWGKDQYPFPPYLLEELKILEHQSIQGYH